MEDRVNYTVVGAFVIILGVALLGIGYWLSNARHNKAHDIFIVYMKEAAAGLNPMAPVKYNGVVVGFVKSLDLDRENPQLVRLKLSIERGTPITQSTVASLLPQGITGMTYIGLKTKKANAPPIKIQPGHHYPVIPSEPSLFVYFGDALLSATNNLNNISQRFDTLFNEKSMTALKETLDNVAELSKTLSNNKNEIDASLKSTTRLLHNASEASEQLPSIIEKIQKTLAKLDNAGSKVNIALQNVSQQAMPGAVRTLEQLERAAQNLQKLTNEVQHNPSIVLRGKQDALGPGER